jgi:hypothetical protein
VWNNIKINDHLYTYKLKWTKFGYSGNTYLYSEAFMTSHQDFSMDKYVRTSLMHLVTFVALSLNMQKEQSHNVTTNCSSTILNFVKICPVAVVSFGFLTAGQLTNSRRNKHEAICTSINRSFNYPRSFQISFCNTLLWKQTM